jgi:ankyrin repeat protein
MRLLFLLLFIFNLLNAFSADYFQLCRNGQLSELIEASASVKNINMKDASGLSLLYYASLNNHPEIVKFLLSNGADPDISTFEKETVLMILAGMNSDSEIIDILLNNNADVNLKDKEGRNALFYLLQGGKNKKILKKLLENGININAADLYGKTALMTAVINFADNEIINLLIEHNADLNIRDNKGKTVLLHAAERYFEKSWSLQLEKGEEFILAYYSNNGKLIYKIEKEETPANSELLMLFIDKGADVTIKDFNNLSVLHMACLNNGTPELIKLIISKGAAVNCVNSWGWTPLMFAACFNDKNEVFKILLEAGADKTVKNNKGKDAAFYSKMYKNTAVLKTLN